MGNQKRNPTIAVVVLAVGLLAIFNIKTITRVAAPVFNSWLHSFTRDVSERGKQKPLPSR